MPAVAKIRDTRIEEQLYFVKEISVLKFWLLSLVLEKLEDSEALLTDYLKEMIWKFRKKFQLSFHFSFKLLNLQFWCKKDSNIHQGNIQKTLSTCKIQLFTKRVNSIQQLVILVQCSIFDVWQSSDCFFEAIKMTVFRVRGTLLETL